MNKYSGGRMPEVKDKLAEVKIGNYYAYKMEKYGKPIWFDEAGVVNDTRYTQLLEAVNSRPSGDKCEWNAAIDKCVEAMKAYNVSGYDIVQDRRTGEPEQEQFDIIGYVESFKRPTP